MKKAAIYTRVSTSQQETNESPQTQIDLCMGLATGKGFSEANVTVFDTDAREAMSGTVLDRDGITELLEYLKSNPDCKDVFVYHFNRLGRTNPITFKIVEDLIKIHHVTIHSYAQKQEINKANYNLAAVITLVMNAEDFSQTELRFAVGKDAAKKQGKPINGATSIGYKRINEGTVRDKKPRFIIDPEHEPFVRTVLLEYLKPNATLSSVNRLVNNLGFRRKGKLLTSVNVYSVLKNAYTYAGEYYQEKTFPKKKLKNGHTQVQAKPIKDIYDMIQTGLHTPFTNIEPYITKEQAKEILEKLISNRRKNSGRMAQVEALFRRMVFCGTCGIQAAVTGNKQGSNKWYYYYSCSCKKQGFKNPNTFKPCTGFQSIRIDEDDNRTYLHIIEYLSKTDLKFNISLHRPEINTQVIEQVKALETQLNIIDTRLKDIESDYALGYVTGKQVNDATNINQTERVRIILEIKNLKPQLDTTSTETANLEYLLENASRILGGLKNATNFKAKRQLLEELQTRLLIKDGKIRVSVRGFPLE